MLEKGLIQLYTGKGKGKTTAAFGLALRAAGRDNKVLIYQFLKPPEMETGERMALAKTTLDIEIRPLDVCWDLVNSLEDKQKREQTKTEIKKVLKEIREVAGSVKYDMIILDEIAFCQAKKLTEIADIKKIIEEKNEKLEIVFTGRDATDELIKICDLVTEMREIKHPYKRGVNARMGIEY